MQLTIFQAKNNILDVKFQCMEFSFKLEGFDIKKSDIDNDKSDLIMEDEHFNQGKKIDKSFSH